MCPSSPLSVPLRDESAATVEQFGSIMLYGSARPVQHVLRLKSLTVPLCVQEMARLSGVPADRLLLCTTFYGKVK